MHSQVKAKLKERYRPPNWPTEPSPAAIRRWEDLQ